MAIRLTSATSRVEWGDVVIANAESGDQGTITVFLDIRPTGTLAINERMFHKWGNNTATRIFVLGVSGAFATEVQFTICDGVGLWGHRTSGLGFTSGRRYRIVASVSGIGSGALVSQFWVNGREYPTVSVFASNCAFVANNTTPVMLGYEPITPTNGLIGDYAAAAVWHTRAPLPTAFRQRVSAGRSPRALRSVGGFFYATLGNDTVAQLRNRWDYDGTGAVPTTIAVTGGGLAELRGSRKRFYGVIPVGGGAQSATSTPAAATWSTAPATATAGARTATSVAALATWTAVAATATVGAGAAASTPAAATWSTAPATATAGARTAAAAPAAATWSTAPATATAGARTAASTPAAATWGTAPATASGSAQATTSVASAATWTAVAATATVGAGAAASTPAMVTWSTAPATATAGARTATSAPSLATWEAAPATATAGARLATSVAATAVWTVVLQVALDMDTVPDVIVSGQVTSQEDWQVGAVTVREDVYSGAVGHVEDVLSGFITELGKQ